jgi:membrane protease YdiL (CAAX protease family)
MGPAPATENLHEEIILQTADAFTKALPACLILLLCTRLVVGGLDGWGLSLRKIPKGVVAGVLGLLVIYPSLIVLNIIVSTGIEYFAHRSEEIHPTLQLLTQPNQALWERIGFIIVAGAVAPVLEEIFFRGLLQTTFMERSWGLLPQENMQGMYRPTPRHRWAAILVTSFIFAAIHLMPDSFLVLFALAVGLGYVYERTGNLWASITLHAAFNCLNMYLFAHAG